MPQFNILSCKTVFSGFFNVDDATVEFEGASGRRIGPVERLCVERGDSAAMLVYNTDEQKLILVRQFRYSCVRHNEPWLLEAVAGKVDQGETAEEAARRETEEEVGFRVRSLTKVADYYGSPGGSSELTSVFYAEVTNEDRVSAGGGTDTDEDLEIVYLTKEQALSMLDNFEIRDSKLLVALQWLKNREV